MESSPTMAIDAALAGHTDCEESKDLLNKDNNNAAPVMAVVAFGKGKDPSSSAAAAKTTTIATDGNNLTVSTGHDECEKAKKLLNKKDTTVMMLATVSSKKSQQASEAKPSLTNTQLCFLTAASRGDWEKLTRLLSRTGDVEEGTTSAASSLLESVTTEGDTALHLVADNGSSGDREEFQRCAEILHEKDKKLLSKKNNKDDTPLHCAARAGKSQLVSFLIGLAKDDGNVQSILRMENKKHETALHEAVRRRNNQMVKELLRADRELASFPQKGTSPLYLSILLEEGSDDQLKMKKEKSMAQILHDESNLLSYLGPNGQNALHAAVRRGSELTRKLLQWNKDLIIQRDKNGSTPLHFAAGLGYQRIRRSVCSILLEANTNALFQLDNNGLSPIHIAASVGASGDIALFVEKCPGSAGLRDAKGKTFLHVAVDNEEVETVYYACKNPSLAWIMNMQDNDGNTALQLAVQSGSVLLFSPLFANRDVLLNITDEEGQTPLDIARYKVPPGLFFNQNSESMILYALRGSGARSGVSRWDHIRRKYEDKYGLKSEHQTKELEKLKELTQARSIGAVLIATVAFGATFALPGGYRGDDDHTNGGTPILAGRYAFDAFMMANTLAFIFSAAAIICLGRGGSPTFNQISRSLHTAAAYQFMEISLTCLIAAFSLGVFVMLSPVAPKTARAICVMSGILLVLCKLAENYPRRIILIPSFCARKGPLRTASRYTWLLMFNMVYEYWPLLLIFLWAAYGRTHPISNMEPPAGAPSV